MVEVNESLKLSARSLRRRSLLTGAIGGLASLAYPSRLKASTSGRCSRLAIADSFEFNGNLLSASQIATRLSLFSSLGIGTIRTELPWGDVEAQPDVATAIDSRYLLAAQAAGFKFKMRVATLGGAPSWFFQNYPDARVLNEAGETSQYTIDLWYPGLSNLLTRAATLVFQRLINLGLMSSVAYLIVDLGQAAEPIYPPAFIEGSQTVSTSSFWYYSKNAQNAFVIAMQAKYGQDVSIANAAWGATFETWASVTIPSPGQVRGAMWSDVLSWYRNSKRTVISQQVMIFRRLVEEFVPVNPPKLVILVPGQHLPTALWLDCVQSGSGNYNLEIMEDTDFLVDLARETGCYLQYTSAQTLSEVEYLQNYISAKGHAIPLFGENAGGSASAALYPDLSQIIVQEGLYGLDYVSSSDFLASDGITPTAFFSAYQVMCQQLVAYLGVDM